MASGKAAGEGAGGVKGGDEARRLEMLDFGFRMYRAGWEAAHTGDDFVLGWESAKRRIPIVD